VRLIYFRIADYLKFKARVLKTLLGKTEKQIKSMQWIQSSFKKK